MEKDFTDYYQCRFAVKNTPFNPLRTHFLLIPFDILFAFGLSHLYRRGVTTIEPRGSYIYLTYTFIIVIIAILPLHLIIHHLLKRLHPKHQMCQINKSGITLGKKVYTQPLFNQKNIKEVQQSLILKPTSSTSLTLPLKKNITINFFTESNRQQFVKSLLHYTSS